MEHPILDLSFLYDLSDNDATYIHEVINIYLDTVPPKLELLKEAIADPCNFESTKEIAHFLKSSSNIVRVRGMHENLAKIEMLAREKHGVDEINNRMAIVVSSFEQALPLILAERDQTMQN